MSTHLKEVGDDQGRLEGSVLPVETRTDASRTDEIPEDARGSKEQSQESLHVTPNYDIPTSPTFQYSALPGISFPDHNTEPSVTLPYSPQSSLDTPYIPSNAHISSTPYISPYQHLPPASPLIPPIQDSEPSTPFIPPIGTPSIPPVELQTSGSSYPPGFSPASSSSSPVAPGDTLPYHNPNSTTPWTASDQQPNAGPPASPFQHTNFGAWGSPFRHITFDSLGSPFHQPNSSAWGSPFQQSTLVGSPYFTPIPQVHLPGLPPYSPPHLPPNTAGTPYTAPPTYNTNPQTPAFHSAPPTHSNLPGAVHTPYPPSELNIGALRYAWHEIGENIYKHDDEKIQSWKRDMDTVLIIAGVLSVILGLFTIQSYGWLSKDPTVSSITALSQILQQLSGDNHLNLSTASTFRPSASVIRINCLWFLALITTLTCSISGILYRQWLHEHFKHTHTQSHTEALALQRLRFDSLKHWGIPHVLSLIPSFLVLALLLFFAGLLEAFWLMNTVLFGIGLAAIGSVFALYIATTVLPLGQIIHTTLALITHRFNDDSVLVLGTINPLQSMCPYKTPQSWLAFLCARTFLGIPIVKQLLYRFSRCSNFGIFQDMLDSRLHAISSWDSLDLGVLRMFGDTSDQTPPVHKLQSLEWLLRTLKDTPALLPSLKTIFWSLPPDDAVLVTTSAYGHQKLAIWGGWSDVNLQEALLSPHEFFHNKRAEVGLDPYGSDYTSTTSFGASVYTQILYYLASWSLRETERHDWKHLYELTNTLYKRNIPLRAKMPFVTPFYALATLWTFPEGQNYERKLGLEFLKFYKMGWVIASQSDTGHFDKLALVTALVNHILPHRTRPVTRASSLLSSPEGLDFLRFVHNKILDEQLYQNASWTFSDIIPKWLAALDVIPRISPQQGSFQRIPGYFPMTLPRLERLLVEDPAESGLVNVLESFKQSWDDVGEHRRQALVKALSHHINSQWPYSIPLRNTSHSTRNDPNASIGFLKFVNSKLVEGNPFRSDGRRHLYLDDWVVALNRIRFSHGLPADYFEHIPNHRRSDPGVESFKPEIGWKTGQRGKGRSLAVVDEASEELLESGTEKGTFGEGSKGKKAISMDVEEKEGREIHRNESQSSVDTLEKPKLGYVGEFDPPPTRSSTTGQVEGPNDGSETSSAGEKRAEEDSKKSEETAEMQAQRTRDVERKVGGPGADNIV